ncbi:MAG: hypothetical protein K6A44_04840 [bacterium]|nr:hypothetical protein [bacterium]
MSVNFSQNPDFIKEQQNNFGAGVPTPEAPHQYSMVKEMGLPTTPKEVVEWMPYFVPAVAASKWLSNVATNATRLNPDKNSAISALESFNKSAVSRMAGKVDSLVTPVATKYASQINSTKGFFSRITPQWLKDLGEKIKIGVTPRNRMALSQYKGMTVMQLDSLLDKLRKLPPDKIQALGLENILSGSIKNSADAAKQAIALLERRSVSELKSLATAKGANLHILEELTKSKAFLGEGGKTAIGRAAQRGLMMVSEAAGGGVVGANWFGIIMNSVFLASTIKRTWNAPWGEKLSTFMEGALVDFCGGYLMALLGAKLTYKLLGIKNADKSVAKLSRIKKLTEAIKEQKEIYANNAKVLKELRKTASEAAVKAAEQAHAGHAFRINRAIERLRKARGFQKATGEGSFIKNLLNRPLRWIGNFFSVGLENLPENVVGQTVKNGKIKNISALRVGWQHIKNSLKTVTGYPMRFILVLMFVTPPLTKLCAKISHTLFGKPTKSIMDEREGKANEKEKRANGSQNPHHVDMDTFNQYTKAVGLAREMAEAQQNPQAYQMRKNAPPPRMSQAFVDDAINTQRYGRTSDTASYIPSSRGIATSRISDISPATYVPSSVGAMKEKSPLSDAVNKQADRADRLARHIEKELAQSKKDAFNF